MDCLNPVFTAAAECQDCYKCIRECPVKAIRVEEGQASIVPELCVHCGRCVRVCPAGAKKIRDDLPRVMRLAGEGAVLAASVAPSFWGEFPGVTEAELSGLMKSLGFQAVSETALGAEMVSSALGEDMDALGADEFIISSACPAVVDYLRGYRPDLLPFLSTAASPLLNHSRLLKDLFQSESQETPQVVFFGPCAAKKREADQDKDLISAALTFQDLRRWMKTAGVSFPDFSGCGEALFPRRAGIGRIYPVEGGMGRTLGEIRQDRVLSLSGLSMIRETLPAPGEPEPLLGGCFLELAACEGGCVYGPASGRGCKSLSQIKAVKMIAASGDSGDSGEVLRRRLYKVEGEVQENAVSEARITAALALVGKREPRDELNCGGCGYDTCRAFARAMAEGRAERGMCVSYLRRLAQKKASALIRTMPSGVVIVDSDLKVVECNEAFSRLLGEDVREMYRLRPGLEGAFVEKLFPAGASFRRVLSRGEEILDQDFRHQGRILHGSVFPIEEGVLAGAIFQDVTLPWVQKDRVVRQAREVIQKNLETVQQIAYLLGENAAEGESILNSIIESFQPEDVVDERGESAYD